MLVSVITICFNAEKEIGKTVKSVLNQSFDDYEFIIVDGMSNDGTLNVVNDIIKYYPNKKVRIISEPDRGIYDAMNKGLKMASGEWVCMMNSGDCFASNNVLKEIFQNL